MRFTNFVENKEKNPVRFDDGKLCIKNSKGEFAAKVDIQGNVNTVYGFNIQYMMDGLSQFKDSDEITIKSGNAYSPIILTDNADNLALVLPVRLKDGSDKNVA